MLDLSIKFSDEIIHDKEVVFRVFLNAKLELEYLSKKLKENMSNEYIIKNEKFLRGKDYKREIEIIKNKLETLLDVFDVAKCKKYISVLEGNTSENNQYIMHNSMETSNHFFNFLIENKKPLGTFFTIKDNKYIGMNNLSGKALIEEFRTKKECLHWLSYKQLEEDWGLEA